MKKPIIITINLRMIIMALASFVPATLFAIYAPQPWGLVLCIVWGGFVGINWNTIWPRRSDTNSEFKGMTQQELHAHYAKYFPLPEGYVIASVIEMGVETREGAEDGPVVDRETTSCVVMLMNEKNKRVVRGVGTSIDAAFTKAKALAQAQTELLA